MGGRDLERAPWKRRNEIQACVAIKRKRMGGEGKEDNAVEHDKTRITFRTQIILLISRHTDRKWKFIFAGISWKFTYRTVKKSYKGEIIYADMSAVKIHITLKRVNNVKTSSMVIKWVGDLSDCGDPNLWNRLFVISPSCELWSPMPSEP